MKIAVLGDLHFISPDDPFKEIHEQRRHFAKAWPTFKNIAAKIRDESPDLVICIGDMVDWYSDENRDFALGLLDELGTPWIATPGNHDYATYQWSDADASCIHLKNGEAFEKIHQGWNDKGIVLDNRVIDGNGTGLICINSASTDVPPGTREWFFDSIHAHKTNIVFTHMPVNLPEVKTNIGAIDPGREEKCGLSNAPWLLDEGKIQYVFSGHLHLPGLFQVRGTTMCMISLSIAAFEKEYPGMGQAAVLDLDRPDSLKIIHTIASA